MLRLYEVVTWFKPFTRRANSLGQSGVPRLLQKMTKKKHRQTRTVDSPYVVVCLARCVGGGGCWIWAGYGVVNTVRAGRRRYSAEVEQNDVWLHRPW